MFPFLNSTQKLIALISVESIGATNEKRFKLIEDSGCSILVDKLNYPGGYALFNNILNKEMLRVEHKGHDLLQVYNLYSNETFEIQLLRTQNNEVKGAIVSDGTHRKDFTIVVKNGRAQYLTYTFEASVIVRKPVLAIAA